MEHDLRSGWMFAQRAAAARGSKKEGKQERRGVCFTHMGGHAKRAGWEE